MVKKEMVRVEQTNKQTNKSETLLQKNHRGRSRTEGTGEGDREQGVTTETIRLQGVERKEQTDPVSYSRVVPTSRVTGKDGRVLEKRYLPLGRSLLVRRVC